MIKDRRGRRLALASALVALPLAMAACGSDDDNSASSGGSASCPGDPVKLMTIQPLTSPIQHETEIPDAAEAAATAINKSCQLGRPLQIISCDDKYNPNTAVACGRQAVSEKVVAIVGTTSPYAQNFVPITAAAGIPDIGDLAASAEQQTNKLVFPLQNGLTLANGFGTTAKSLGATKVAVVSVNVPAATTITSQIGATITAQGMQSVDPILVPATTTDMTQAAAQALATGADAILSILPKPLTVTLIKNLDQAGADFNKTRFITGSTVLGPATVAELGSTADGLFVVGSAWPTADSSNEGIAQYNSELAAAGKSDIESNSASVIAWSSVHIVADLLEGSPTMDAATLVQKLRGLTSSAAYPQLAPFDFSKNAFPDNPTLSALNAYSHDAVVAQAVDGELKPATSGWVDYRSTFPITPVT